MKYFFPILIISLLLSTSNFAQKSVNPDLAIQKINPVLLLNQPKQVVRNATTTFRVNNLKSGELRVRQIITLFNNKSDANQIYVFYDQESKIKDLSAIIYDAEGRLIRRIDKDEYKDVAQLDGFSLYQDNRLKYADISYNTYPYTIVWEYTKELQGIEYALFPNWHPQEYGEAVEESTFEISIPDDQKLYTKALNLDQEPIISQEGKRINYSWRLKNLIAVHSEPYSPSSYYTLPKLLTAPESFEVDSYAGSMASWKDYGLFMNKLYAGRDELPETVATEIKKLTVNAQSKQEKIQLVYNYLQEKMRYVSVQLGIGGWQPFSAKYVAENSYGDCKALTNYMMSLLKVVDIKAYPVLIRNGDLYYEITEDFTFPAFNHVILYIPEEDLWLECTSNNYPLNYIGSGNYNRSVMLVTEEGGKLVQTPSQTKADNKESIKASIQIDGEGAAKIQYSSMLAGSQHERYRYMHHNYSAEEQRKWVLKQLEIPNFQLSTYEIKSEGSIPCAQYDFSGTSSKYVSTSGSRMFIPINKISSYGGVPEKEELRRFPVIHEEDYQEELEIEIQLPEGWEPESLPPSEKSFSSPFGSYKMTCQREGNRILINRTIQFNRHKGDPESYEAFRKFYRDVNRAEQSQVVVKL